MYIKEIETKVLELFKQYPGAELKVKEISSILSIKKHDYKNLNDTIRKLIKDNLLIKDKQYITSNIKEETHAKNDGNASSKTTKGKDNNQSRDNKSNVPLIEATFDATSLAKGYSFGFAITEENDYFI